jgi:hypothetical protein
VADLRPTLDPQVAEAGGARVEGDEHRFLYIGTQWAEEVVTDHRDVDEFKEASRTIGCLLLVRVLA